MAYIKKANVILEVSDDKDIVNTYVNQGWDVVDKSGKNVIIKTMPKDSLTLSKMLKDSQELCKKLQDKIESLEAELKDIKSKKSEPKAETKKSKKE